MTNCTSSNLASLRLIAQRKTRRVPAATSVVIERHLCAVERTRARSARVLGSPFAVNYNAAAAPTALFASVHGVLLLDDPATATSDHRLTVTSSGHVYEGLPVVGFAAQLVINANAQPGTLANYTSANPHRYATQR